MLYPLSYEGVGWDGNPAHRPVAYH
jgi:hypothetical protein